MITVLAAAAAACRARGDTQWRDEVQAMAVELAPKVEQAVGLQFKYPPKVAARSRDEVYDYLLDKIANELPPDEIERVSLAYRLFGLIPDTLDLERLLLDLYTEQIVGFYDPLTDSLYVVEGADQFQIRLVVAHELIHALQAQYVELGSLLGARGDNDRRTAAQAIMEGQGILASLKVLMPNADFAAMPDFWRQARQQVRAQQQRMPVFNSAPLILREVLIFPYLAGADFVEWFGRTYPDTVPYGPRLPRSTEQILWPDRYRAGDEPVSLRFVDSTGIVYDDGLGEFETRVLVTEASGSESTATATARGWGGDRFGVFETAGSHALVWWTVWDAEQDAKRFATVLERDWANSSTAGRRRTVERTEVERRPAVVLVDAPIDWSRWGRLPRVVEWSGEARR